MLSDVEVRRLAADSCRKEITRLQGLLEELEGSSPKKRHGRPAATSSAPQKPRRKMSAAARKRVSERMKKFWAERKGKK